jgi:hypothetical protein
MLRTAVLLLIVGIVLSPLRAVAAMVPMLIAYDVAGPRTATTRVEVGPSLRSDRGSVSEYVYDDILGADGSTPSPPVAAGAGTIHAYDRALELTDRREAANGVLYAAAAATAAAKGGPSEPYNRAKHYGRTPTAADRSAVGAGQGEVADHDPPLVQRYYEGDPAKGEKPGYEMTPAERAASASDRSRMDPQPMSDSNAQGGRMRAYSMAMRRFFHL